MRQTPAAARAEDAVGHLPVTRVGTYNRRKIAGTSAWSQHSWANAKDFHVSSLQDGDTVYGFLEANRGALGIRVLLWRVRDHFDHIHADFWPKGVGTPPLTQRGKGSFRYPDGNVTTARIREVPAYGEGLEMALRRGDNGAAVKYYQEALNNWPSLQTPLEVDGAYGPATETAVRQYQRAAELAETGSIGSPEDFLIGRYHPEFNGGTPAGVDVSEAISSALANARIVP